MIFFVIFLMCLKLLKAQDITKDININVYKDLGVDGYEVKCRAENHPTIMKYANYNININSSVLGPIYRARCTLGTEEVNSFKQEGEYRYVSTNYFEKNDLKVKITTCKCIFYTHKCMPKYSYCYWKEGTRRNQVYLDHGTQCDFPVIVNEFDRNVGPRGYMIVNDTSIKLNATANGLVGRHLYHSGERQKFTCKANYPGTLLKIIYISKDGEEFATKFENVKTLDWYIKGTPNNNGATLECHLVDSDYNNLFVTKILLENIETINRTEAQKDNANETEVTTSPPIYTTPPTTATPTMETPSSPATAIIGTLVPTASNGKLYGNQAVFKHDPDSREDSRESGREQIISSIHSPTPTPLVHNTSDLQVSRGKPQNTTITEQLTKINNNIDQLVNKISQVDDLFTIWANTYFNLPEVIKGPGSFVMQPSRPITPNEPSQPKLQTQAIQHIKHIEDIKPSKGISQK